MRANFQISETNPNAATGVGGCACTPVYNSDAHGPYAVFNGPHIDSVDHALQQNVVCAGCIHIAAKKLLEFQDEEPILVDENLIVEDEIIPLKGDKEAFNKHYGPITEVKGL